MKKTITLLVAFALLMSLVSMPASAAGNRQTVHPAYTDGPDALNEALNVPGGTLNFVSDNFVAWGMPAWDWVVDDDGFARSHPEQTDLDPTWLEMGVEASNSGMHFTYDFKENQAVRFKVKIDCQNAANTDYFALSISGNKPFLYTIYGQHDWTTVTVPISAGISQIWFDYNKDTSISEGKDAVWVDDVEVIPYDHSMGLEYSEELSNALNVPGGKLEFFTPGEAADDGYYPWEVKEGYAKSTNEGINCGAGNTPPSSSVLTTTVQAEEGDILYFRWRVSSESLMDRYRFFMDGGEPMESWSAVTDWAVYFCELEPGEHELMWRYDKDHSNHAFEDAAFLDDVYVGKPIPATGVTIQQEATLPASRKLQLDWDILPDTAWNREAVFTSSDENVATVDHNGLVYGISEGEATITVTTKDGNFTGTCHVTVTTSEPPSNLYGFVMKRMLDNNTMYYENTDAWYSFTDLDPEDAAKLGVMPASRSGDVQEGSTVSCAELVDDVVYGYTSDGHFFTMDLDALKGESIAETDWDALDSSKITYHSVNITGQDWNLNDMAFDYSTQTMYVIRLAGDYERGSVDVLYQVNMETGEVLESTQKEISGEGEAWDAADTAYSLAIDMSGNAYIMLAGWGKMWGGNGCSRLAKLDLETGSYTLIGQTSAPCFYEQAMCFDHDIGTLYWAQYAWYPDVIQLYTVDPETAELTDCGKITPKGAHVRAMFVPLCEHEQVTAVPEKAPTCTEPGMAAYWFCEDCGNYFIDEDAVEQTTPEELVIPAAGHKTEQKNQKAAACTEKGYTGDAVCTVCHEMVEKGEEIPALGHDYQDGDCTRCGENDPNAPKPVEKAPFPDVPETIWYREAVDYVYHYGLMNGMEDGSFQPGTQMNRAMLVTVLWRYAGEPKEGENIFRDVENGRYYTDAIAWAAKNQIVNGVGDNKFAPEAPVTRQQLVTILFRYATQLEKASDQRADLSKFPDGGQVSDFAREAMQWAVAEGMINGTSLAGSKEIILFPHGQATRAEVATVLMHFIENALK